jgi:UDP-N-acetylmuramate: L-alanyl-gamma-D-glutamyl-meso-diaminopimelate ligase
MKHFYFIGIGGTAMAATAVALHARGDSVHGSDSVLYPPMSGFLEQSGIQWHQGFDAAHIEELPADTRIIVGNAISRGNPELEVALRERRMYTSLAALAGEELIHGRRSVVIAGTHGKSTTSSLAAWVLDVAGLAPGFLIGGIPENFGMGCRATADGGVFISEGDEYDTAFFDKRSKFVHYRPDIAVINNIEYDHADIFDSLDQVKRSFRQLINLVPDNGVIIANGDDHHTLEVIHEAHSPVLLFGLGYRNMLRARDIRFSDGRTAFTVFDKTSGREYRYRIPLAGEFNVRNALAAIAVARQFGVDEDRIQQAFAGFKSIRRRMEVVAESENITLIDDFAHHPTALSATLTALREKYPGRRLVACFEPRSNTTTRNIYQHEIADALALADVAVIGAIDRPQRYSEAERLSPERVARDLEAHGMMARAIADPIEMAEWVASISRPGDVITMCSNGRFGGALDVLKERLLFEDGKKAK